MPNPEHVFGGHKIMVGVKLKKDSGIPKEKNATFTFKKGDDELGKVDVEISKSTFGSDSFSGEFEVPDPEEGEDSYALKCELTVGDKKMDYGQEWEVWHQRIKVTTRKQVDDEGLKDQGFTVLRLTAGGDTTEHHVGSTGTVDLLLPVPGPFELAVPSPWKFVQWLDGKEKGSVRIMEIEVAPCKARLVDPGAASEAIKRFVNLSEGNEVSIQLASQTQTGDLLGDQQLFVEVKFTNETKRGKGNPAAPDADYQKERSVEGLTNVTKADEDMTWKGELKTGSDGKGRFTVVLGKGGGETCEVKVGSTNTCEDESVKFETWRKLYVQYCHSGTDKSKKGWPADNRTPVIDSFKDVFIDLECLDDVQYPDDMSLGDRCGWHDGDEIGESAGSNYFVVNIDGSAWRQIARKLEPDDTEKKKLWINVGACDLMFEVHNQTGTLYFHKDDCTCPLHTAKGKKAEKLGKSMGGKDVFVGKLPKKPIFKSEAKYELFKVENSKSTSLGEGRKALPEKNLKLSSKPKSDQGKLEITLPDDVYDRMKKDGIEVQVYYDIMMRVEDAGAEGVSDGANSVILCHNAKGDTNSQNTVIHEVGHAIGMCGDVRQLSNKGRPNQVDRLPDYPITTHAKANSDHYADHGRWYEKRGHQGNHCAEGQGQGDYDKWKDLDGVSVKNVFGGYKCVIYGQTMGMKNKITWCPRCQEMLKAMEVWVGAKPKA